MKIKKYVLFLIFASVFSLNLFAQLDRSIQPKPGPAAEIQLGDYESFELANGLKVFVIENHKLPKVTFRLETVRDPIKEGKNAGYISIAGQLLRRGTTTKTKAQIDEAIDFIGASLSTSGRSIYGSSLKKHFPSLMEVISDVVLNSNFKQEELDKIKKQTISNLAAAKEEPNAIASNLRSVLVYGNNHPYGEVATEESVESISLEMCKDYYKDYFKPNISLLALVGDINIDEAKELIENNLGTWEKKDVPSATYKTPKAPLVRKVAISDRDASVQSVVNISYPIELKKGSDDVIKASVLNTILGGTFSARLMQNLREDKAYTYGSYSSISSDKLVGSFTASAKVRNEVTDSAVTEIFNEMQKLRDEKVGEVELTRFKNYLTGSFSRALEQPQTIATFALNIEKYNLSKNYYKNYLKKLNNVSADDIQNMAKKYLRPKNSNVIVVGSAKEVAS
ncbi:MAG: pitrilysin family protein, partial [Melioribacteraceae bacterium]